MLSLGKLLVSVHPENRKFSRGNVSNKYPVILFRLPSSQSPNFSGKSVFLSQVALQVMLAQIGSFVPAKKMVLSVIDSINTRISSFESVGLGQSSFFMDSCQVSRMLLPSRGRALNLIDEYGKGTSEADGMALLAATLRDFLDAALPTSPICICATHFYEILRDPFLPVSTPRMSVYSMEILSKTANESSRIGRTSLQRQVPVQEGCVSAGPGISRLRSQAQYQRQQKERCPVGETDSFGAVVRTYRLLPGSICHESRAFQCALEAGVPKFILRRAALVRQVISGSGYIEDTIPTEENNRRLRSCGDSVRDLLSSNYSEESEP